MSEVKKYKFNGNIVEAIQYTEKSGNVLRKLKLFSYHDVLINYGDIQEFKSGQTNGGVFPQATVKIKGVYSYMDVDVSDWIVKFNDDKGSVLLATDDMVKEHFVEISPDVEENTEGWKLDKTDMPTKLGDLDLSDLPRHPLTDEDETEPKVWMAKDVQCNSEGSIETNFHEVKNASVEWLLNEKLHDPNKIKTWTPEDIEERFDEIQAAIDRDEEEEDKYYFEILLTEGDVLLYGEDEVSLDEMYNAVFYFIEGEDYMQIEFKDSTTRYVNREHIKSFHIGRVE